MKKVTLSILLTIFCLFPTFCLAETEKVYYMKSDAGYWKKISPPPNHPECECQIYTKDKWECVTEEEAKNTSAPVICGQYARNIMIQLRVK